ncbi:Ras GTPase-activating protein-binding protein 2 [Triplophysa tibetana]|uniref:Ras GTPase-activating protein-binding protein 2 n=1 Tax=Triplophysa tibetana TaxID=1572043 RepID=A0A5A9NB32_9TELE|nr:Ras GTPase-activating protein-binding protein 2 [Triplophysa tibetana]
MRIYKNPLTAICRTETSFSRHGEKSRLCASRAFGPVRVRGREFVRQYYTLLNKAPDYLHRFYGRNSSYVHGGVDGSGQPEEAVYGQAEIHTKVMSLQFSECHTKIRHVDAHATLGDGVVVQVMGELSNGGRAMRRFMQTFVLAPEGSAVNKFYVHNDIFRYEEEVFGDSEAELAEVPNKQTHARAQTIVAFTSFISLSCFVEKCGSTWRRRRLEPPESETQEERLTVAGDSAGPEDLWEMEWGETEMGVAPPHREAGWVLGEVVVRAERAGLGGRDAEAG